MSGSDSGPVEDCVVENYARYVVCEARGAGFSECEGEGKGATEVGTVDNAVCELALGIWWVDERRVDGEL